MDVENNHTSMTPSARLAELLPFVGRRCVYIEDAVFSVARVASVAASESEMRAVMEAVPELPLVCRYRDKPRQFTEEPHPQGDQWEISKAWNWFYLSEDLWDGSPYFGFRALFAPHVLEKFLARDLSWIDEYF